jgi:hypothetical protein
MYDCYQDFVISSSFLESDWGQYELDMARMHMFQQNREMLIVITLEEMSISRMPAKLCLYAKRSGENIVSSDSTHHFFRNACTKSGSLRFSQFSDLKSKTISE